MGMRFMLSSRKLTKFTVSDQQSLCCVVGNNFVCTTLFLFFFTLFYHLVYVLSKQFVSRRSMYVYRAVHVSFHLRVVECHLPYGVLPANMGECALP